LIRNALITVCIIIALTQAARAGKVFDDYLNRPVIDQQCPAGTETEGLGLVVDKKATLVPLTKESPIGQTFRVGSWAHKLWRVSTGVCFWPDHWSEGEEVTFTLYDSPAKRNKLYSQTVTFEHKWRKWDMCFDVHLPIKPNTEYYFEFTHNGGGDNSVGIVAISNDSYPRGQAYVGGQPQPDKDLYFVVICKPVKDRVANLKGFLDQFDYSRPELAAAKKAYDNGKLDEACTKVLRAFEAHLRKDGKFWLPDPKNKAAIVKKADQIVDENRQYRDPEKRDCYKRTDNQRTWREVWPGDNNTDRQNDLFTDLGHAYYLTKNEKYAHKLAGLMMDFMQDNASPFDGGMSGGSRWVAMGIAWRLGDAWDGMFCALDSKGLNDDVRLAWIDYQCRMAHFAMTEPSGGNHANAVGDALMTFAARFPLYRDSKKWFDFGYEKLCSNTLKQFWADGGCREPAMNYHGFSLATLLSGLETARKFGLKTPEEVMNRLEKALAYTAYMLKPDGQVPSYGDTDIEEFRPNIKKWQGWREGEAMKAYTMFGREDCLYIATAGKKGKRPEQCSYNFPITRHYILRSDWGGENGEGFEDARYLFLRGGNNGSHGHWDLNQITLYAYGRPLIIDPGRTDYGTPLMVELSKATSHNVLLCDDRLDQNNDKIELREWHTTPAMDLVDNHYAQIYPGVSHGRAIVFVRPDYFVVFDRAQGKEPHNLGINFWLTPPEVTIDKASGSVRTNEPNGSNLLLKLVDASNITITDRKGTIDKDGKKEACIPVVTFWAPRGTEANFATILYPYPKGAGSPDITVKNFKPTNGHLVAITTPNSVDYVYYAEQPGSAKGRDAEYDGLAGLIRTADGSPTSFALVKGTSVSFSGKYLAKADNVLGELSVRYLPDKVEVMCSKSEPSLVLASMGRQKAVVNGVEKTISGDTFKAFD